MFSAIFCLTDEEMETGRLWWNLEANIFCHTESITGKRLKSQWSGEMASAVMAATSGRVPCIPCRMKLYTELVLQTGAECFSLKNEIMAHFGF